MIKIIGFGAGALLAMGIACAAPADGVPAQRFIADHKATIDGRSIHYRSTVEEMFAYSAAGKRTASIYTISYVRTDVPKNTPRPILFVFNGGPGSASIWLNMGFVGPKRVDVGDPPTIRTRNVSMNLKHLVES